MADRRQFGNPKVLQFGDKTVGNQPGDSGHCAQCEAMLADALDGTLSATDQEIFDGHMASCGPCSQMLADARRGAAWLEMLRYPRPEPSAALLERILAETSGAQANPAHAGFVGTSPAEPIPALAPGYGPAAGYGNLGNVVPFPARMAAAIRRSAFGQIAMQPRLAMTAAMAFFSIALTMNLTGVRLQDLRASDFRPSSLKRDFATVNTHVVQYYEGLRVVYELESRVHDLQTATDNGDAGSQGAPQSSPSPQASPNGAAPSEEPDQPGPATPPEQRQRPAAKPAPNSGTSRRESRGNLLSLAAMTSPGVPTDGQPAELMDAFPNSSVLPANNNRMRVEGSLV